MLRFESGLTEACPNCGGQNIAPVQIEEQSEEYTVITRKYPFGRLIITCQDVLLYDGPSQIELDCIFPFAVYTHYRDGYNRIFDPDLDPALDPADTSARFPPRGRPGHPNGLWEMVAPADQTIVKTILANVGKSFEAWERRLVSKDAPIR